MYEDMKYTRACVKLLNNSGPQGCEAADMKLITGPLVHYSDLTHLAGQKVVLVPAEDASKLFTQFLRDSSLRKDVIGILVDPTTGRPPGDSAAPPFPGAEFAPYSARDYVWNPYGAGLTQQWFGIPIYMLTETLANETGWRADYNAQNDLKGGKHVARMQLPMQAVGNSSQCISDQHCLPVGGYGVWSAVPVLPDPLYVNVSARPITLVTASMDSNSLFHDLTKGANTAMSGLIAGLVAMSLLVRANHTATYARQLAFAALPGEAFGYMGSKRLLYEMQLNSTFVRGLSLDLIDQVIDVNQVGAAFNASTNTSSFYLHTQLAGGFGDASKLVGAAQSAATAEEPLVQAAAASPSNPGIPPSPLMSFLRVKPGTAGMVLADFDSRFNSPYYQSEYDDGFNITVQALVDASVLLARTLHSLAGSPETPALEVNRTATRFLVAELAVCLILEDPGMRCPLASLLMSPDVDVYYDGSTSAAVKGYPGVLRWVDVDPRASRSKPNLARFVYNYLGNLTAAPLPADRSNSSWEGAPCDTTVNICPAPLACIGWRYGTKDPAGMGRCRNTTTLYFPAYSTRLWYGNRQGSWRWWVDDAAAVWERNYSWPTDPMWTESDWPARTPTLTIFQEEAEATQILVLVVGLVITFATGLVSWLGVRAFEKHIKSH
ncbi:hypothetical protein CHLRE_06g294400v5 [Chlamydomonas reinhardtii]|uniref:Nicastrin n=1 Tax=Chlamydomonas reinhardtii TaxID=3055 RepID=A0A2K3DQH1_CHLRE|nr:uncharacterized protein CHLRE_06g294400v5 [Chlamydomonas reinhardtii]PNW82792.1 hypothetical protein CHLRE_06g294400v5 [Chlamydomonas reinhardtii]